MSEQRNAPSEMTSLKYEAKYLQKKIRQARKLLQKRANVMRLRDQLNQLQEEIGHR